MLLVETLHSIDPGTQMSKFSAKSIIITAYLDADKVFLKFLRLAACALTI